MSIVIVDPYVFSFDPDVRAWLNRGTALGYTLPSSTVQNALSDFIKSLKTNGLFTRMKTGYIMHAGSSQMGTLNLKNPLTYQTTLVNSPTFSEGNGMKSNGTTSYIDQPFKSNEFVGIQSNLTVINYVSESNNTTTGISTNGFLTKAGQYFALNPLHTTTEGRYFHYGPSPWLPFSNTNHKGLYIGTHSSPNTSIYKDGIKTTAAQTPEAPTNSINRLILAYNDSATDGAIAPANFYTAFVSVDFLFDSFTDADESNFRTAFNTYKTAVALP